MERIRIFLMGSLFSLLWASAFIAGKAALEHSDPISLLCARFAAAGGLMLAWVLISGQAHQLRNRALWLDGLVLGILNNALYLGLSFQGLRTVSSEATVLIVSTAPFFTIVFSILSGGPRSLRQLAGMAVGCFGDYTVLSARMQGSDDPQGMVLVLLGTVAFALGTVWYRHRAAQHNPLVLNGVQNFVGAIVLMPFAQRLPEAFIALQHFDYFVAFAHLVLMVSIIDFLIWLALLRRIGTAQASSFHLLNPIFGIFLSALVFSTAVLGTDMLGSLIVIAGLVIVSWSGKMGYFRGQQRASNK